MSKPAPNVKDEIQQLVDDFVRKANAKDVDALVHGYYAENASLLPPNHPIVEGRANIRNFWKGFIEAGAADVAVHTKTVESSGDLAYEIGAYSFTLPNPQGGRSTNTGKYVVVYKRQPDGSLKAVADMFSANE